MQLKDITIINPGYPFRGTIPEVLDGTVKAVQMRDVSVARGIHWPGCVSTQLRGKRQPDWLQAGDLLFAARGNHNYAVVVDDAVPSESAVAAPHFFHLRLITKDVYPEFLAWYLNQLPTQNYIQINAEGSLTKSIRRDVLECTTVVLPEKSQQEEILKLAAVLRQERKLAEALIQRGEDMMAAIAAELEQGTL